MAQNEDQLFKKQNTAKKKFFSFLNKFWDITKTVFEWLWDIIWSYGVAIVFFGFIIWIVCYIVSCDRRETRMTNEYLSKVDSCRSIVRKNYPSTKIFTYDLKSHKDDGDKVNIIAVDNGIVNTFIVNRHNVIIHEDPTIEKSYVKIESKLWSGKILKWDASEDAINYPSYEGYEGCGCNFEKISWGLRDKITQNVIPGVWDDNNIWFDITNLVKDRISRIDNDTDDSFRSRHYYLMYMIRRVDIYVKYVEVKYE